MFATWKLLVVKGSAPSLLGRDWLSVLRLDWRKIARITTCGNTKETTVETRLSELKEKYQEVFSPALGTITPFQARLSVKEGASPKFVKARPVPFALRERVEAELDRLENEGVLVKVPYSDWAARRPNRASPQTRWTSAGVRGFQSDSESRVRC